MILCVLFLMLMIMTFSMPSEGAIFEALGNIGATKAPGPDGMTSFFYRHFRPIVKRDVVDTIQGFFRGGDNVERIEPLSYCSNS